MWCPGCGCCCDCHDCQYPVVITQSCSCGSSSTDGVTTHQHLPGRTHHDKQRNVCCSYSSDSDINTFHFIRMLQVGGQVRLNFRTVWINKYVMTTFKLQVSLHSYCSCLWFSCHKIFPRTSKFENDSDFVSGIYEKWPQFLVKD